MKKPDPEFLEKLKRTDELYYSDRLDFIRTHISKKPPLTEEEKEARKKKWKSLPRKEQLKEVAKETAEEVGEVISDAAEVVEDSTLGRLVDVWKHSSPALKTARVTGCTLGAIATCYGINSHNTRKSGHIDYNKPMAEWVGPTDAENTRDRNIANASIIGGAVVAGLSLLAGKRTP